jgi:hypothetical protein
MAALVDPDSALTTYRYLRTAMVLLAVMLGLSVVVEWFRTSDAAGIAGRCALTSISAYYYSPARSLFVGVLFAMGVCLVAIKGNPQPLSNGCILKWVNEDTALNIAGLLALLVPLVPTGQPTNPENSTEYLRCMSVPFTAFNTSPNITNNVGVLAIGGLMAVLAAAFVAPARPSLMVMVMGARTGLIAAVMVLIGLSVWYFVWTPNFRSHAHDPVAVGMFVAMWFAVLCNAQRVAKPTRFRRIYRATLVGMPGSAVVIGGLRLAGWRHGVLWLEAAEIALFASFWATQTFELWDFTSAPVPAGGPDVPLTRSHS